MPAIAWYKPVVRIAVIGHVEWVEFLRVEGVPAAGDIVHAEPILEVAAGGGAVAAVQLARWGARTQLYTALGDDPLGRRAGDELGARGVEVHTGLRREPQRRAVTLVDAQRERTIVVVGNRLVAHGNDALPWEDLARCDAVYITGGDEEAVRLARRARVVVATSRILPVLREAAIELDALVGSDNDPAEAYAPGDLAVPPRLVVRTSGARGGHVLSPDGTRRPYAAAPATVTGDTYGAGDTFAAGLTMALGEGRTVEGALTFAAARAAEVLAWHGPYPP